MDDRAPTPLPQLVEANRRLHELRAQVQAAKAHAREPATRSLVERPGKAGDEPIPDPRQASLLATAAIVGKIGTLPAHLGWGSMTLAAAIRRRQRADRSKDDSGLCFERRPPAAGSRPAASGGAGDQATWRPPSREWVKLYPDIGLGMLRQEKTASGRLWVLLRYLDEDGCGALRIDIITHQLTQRTSTIRLCGKRHLRNLLRDGEGVFWERDEEHVWLASAARVACALGVERLTGRPVALPIAALLNGIGQFRAHLYTAFHSGRAKESAPGQGGMPIARATLTAVTGVSRRGQQAYEKRTGIRTQANYAVGERDGVAAAQQRTWRQGQAMFKLKDYRGYQGRRGRTYLAWQLPNSYSCPHDQRPQGRQKRINRKLADLFMKGMTGNGEGKVERRYWPTGKLAARAYSRSPAGGAYWPGQRLRGTKRRLWYVSGGT
jgi:hypothetical protein